MFDFSYLKGTVFRKTKRRLWVLSVFGLITGCVALWFAMRGVAYNELAKTIGSTSVSFLVASWFAYLTNVFLRVFRWHLFFSQQVSLPLVAAKTQLLGMAVNNVLPARIGEVFRIEYAHRLFGVARGYCAGVLIGERTLDLISLALVLFIGTELTDLGDGNVFSADWSYVKWGFGLLLAVSATFVLILYLFSRSKILSKFGCSTDTVNSSSLRFRRVCEWLHREMMQASESFRDKSANIIIAIIVTTFLVWCFEALSLYFVFLSLGIDINFGGVALVLFAVSLSTLIPSAPGYVGTFQLAFVVALSFLGIESALAVSASILHQLFNVGVFSVLGFLSFFVFRPQRDN